jgi:hypothetical protein
MNTGALSPCSLACSTALDVCGQLHPFKILKK